MARAQELRTLLRQLDQRSYKAYKQIQGTYTFPEFTLHIDYVQGDPFAAPSRLRLYVCQVDAKSGRAIAGFPSDLYSSRSRKTALTDYINRKFEQVAHSICLRRGSGNSGQIAIARPGQQIIERTAVSIDDQGVEVRFTVGLPARGRQILGIEAAELLCDDLPELVRRSLYYQHLQPEAVVRHVNTAEDSDALRRQLEERGLVAFIADGACLPRQSGVDDRPLPSGALPFRSPELLRVTLTCPNRGQVSGMGIPAGVTLIVGGGYHGKSTLLRAIATGIYNHIPGDGREAVVTHPQSVKIRAEDGRSVAGVNISPFINHLPQGRSTTQFCTDNASGSTSQAANIIEALEAGARVLLLDEDTSATNFMIRDRRMQALIAKSQEPITPFIDKVRQLYRDYGVSTILVMGGSGDYFDVADTVIAMTEFQPQEVTAQAQAIARQFATDRAAEGGDNFGTLSPRVPIAQRLESRGDRPPKLKARDVDELIVGQEAIDLSGVEQLVEVGQLRTIGAAIAYIYDHYLDGRTDLKTILEYVGADLDAAGMDALTAYPQGDLVAIRLLDLAAALNRLRSLQVAPD